MLGILSQLLAVVTAFNTSVGCRQADPKLEHGAEATYTVAQRGVNYDSLNSNVTASRRNAITIAVSKASPAVVGINVTEIREQRVRSFFDDFFMDDPMMRQFFGRSAPRTMKQEVKGLGSGFIISPDGYILTNDHVAGNASKIIVTMTNGTQHDAKLIGTDKTADVALLKIDGKNLPNIPLGNSSDLAVGEWAIALGNPFGLFDINDKPTVTVGVISNTGVNLGLQETRNYRDMIQTDAAISSGNSGGPLLNANGEAIGINATIYSTATTYNGAGSIGLGFAIPINKVKAIVNDLKSGRAIDRYSGDPGFRVMALDDETRQYFNVGSADGVVVSQMRKGSPAAEAGLQVGDVITAVNKERVRSADDLMSILAEQRKGTTLTLKILRDEKDRTISIRLE